MKRQWPFAKRRQQTVSAELTKFCGTPITSSFPAFSTRGGRIYLANLLELHPSPTTINAIVKALRDEDGGSYEPEALATTTTEGTADEH